MTGPGGRPGALVASGFDRLAQVVAGRPGQPGTLLTVWAHPDDESYLAGGLMAAASAAGWRVVCVTATLGELGGDGGQRAAELAAALAVLGVSEHLLLGHPDGGCADADTEQSADQVATVVGTVRPDVVVTFGPDGFTGHPDHQTVSRWVDRALAVSAGWARSSPPRPSLLHTARGANRSAEFAGIDRELGVTMPGAELVTWPDDEVALTVSLTGSALDRKVAALRAHRSQTEALVERLGEDRYAHWVAAEQFVVASSPA